MVSKGIKRFMFFIVGVFFISIVSAIPLAVSPHDASGDLTPSTTYSYQFNFSTDSSCSNVVVSFVSNITTNNEGIGYVNLNIENMTGIPSYLCEYRGGSLRKTHQLSDLIVRNIYAENGNFTGNLSSMGQMVCLENGTNCDQSAYSTYNSTYDNFGSTYNETYNLWAYNQTTATYNLYNGIWVSTYNLSYDGLINNATYIATFNATYDFWAYNQSLIYSHLSNFTNDIGVYNATYDLWAYNQTIFYTHISNFTNDADFINSTNVAFTNQTNTFAEQQIFNDCVNISGSTICGDDDGNTFFT